MKNDSNYDYINAIIAGLHTDEEGHWPSRVGKGSQEGLILKSYEHDTFLEGLMKELDEGYVNWYRNPEDKKLYTFNKIEDSFKRFMVDNLTKVK